MKFVKRCKVWKLKEAEAEGVFRERVQTRAAERIEKPGDVGGFWKDLKECLLNEAVSFCEEKNGISKHKRDLVVATLVKEKSTCSSCGMDREGTSARKSADARKSASAKKYKCKGLVIWFIHRI